LILDEPTSGLDPGSRSDLLAMIVELRRERGVSTLFSSHNLDDVADIATHIGILHEGRIIFTAPTNVIRDELTLVQIPLPRSELPAALQEQIAYARTQDGIAQWVIANRDHDAVRGYLATLGEHHVQWKPLTVKKLFLFLTSPRLLD
jgi:ABC-2 type transport system ATP-binding protein